MDNFQQKSSHHSWLHGNDLIGRPALIWMILALFLFSSSIGRASGVKGGVGGNSGAGIDEIIVSSFTVFLVLNESDQI